MTQLKLKRAYQPASADDGYRVFVDRLWPRGLAHATFKYDAWDKDIAPSNDLRKWFHAGGDARWSDFVDRYRIELVNNPAWSDFVATLAGHQVVTLIYAAHDETENNAVALSTVLTHRYPDKFKI